MPQFRKAAVIGVGLIGGSLAAALKKKKLVRSVTGISRRKSTVNTALKKGLIDDASTSLAAVAGADLLVFAVPPGAVKALAAKAASLAGRNCLVIDVCSTKVEVSRILSRYFPAYAGCHPLAGSEKKGPENADPGLFKGALCVITGRGRSASTAAALWRSIGSRVAYMSPSEHDKILAYVSHLPHSVAFSLIDSVPETFYRFSAGGLKDTTRIAASDSSLWADIIMSNRRNVARALGVFETKLKELRSAVSRGDVSALEKFLSRASSRRRMLEGACLSGSE
jgi:prephenate dehydrogenase